MLRAGMIVVVRNCKQCGGSHRCMLTRFDPASSTFDEPTPEPAWLRLPQHHPQVEKWIAVSTVRKGNVYRVIDGLENNEILDVSNQQPAKVDQ